MPDHYLHISLSDQRLTLWQDGEAVLSYAVSTALNGAGERNGSGQTPRGWHRIRARIGAGCAPGTVFVGRRPTGECYSPALAEAHPERDWILSRILWLCGNEPGKNRLGDVDSMRRYIYIHGCPDTEPMGEPRSHGCVRMRNADIIELFDRLPAELPVLIEE
ncbi:MAG TPA: murein L,D-transpeptidase [Gammaproteobacteria bacterium]|nr:murein L,D-transpeptidase [Gammaproteobacteria bacterium]